MLIQIIMQEKEEEKHYKYLILLDILEIDNLLQIQLHLQLVQLHVLQKHVQLLENQDVL